MRAEIQFNRRAGVAGVVASLVKDEKKVVASDEQVVMGSDDSLDL